MAVHLLDRRKRAIAYNATVSNRKSITSISKKEPVDVWRSDIACIIWLEPAVALVVVGGAGGAAVPKSELTIHGTER